MSNSKFKFYALALAAMCAFFLTACDNSDNDAKETNFQQTSVFMGKAEIRKLFRSGGKGDGNPEIRVFLKTAQDKAQAPLSSGPTVADITPEADEPGFLSFMKIMDDTRSTLVSDGIGWFFSLFSPPAINPLLPVLNGIVSQLNEIESQITQLKEDTNSALSTVLAVFSAYAISQDQQQFHSIWGDILEQSDSFQNTYTDLYSIVDFSSATVNMTTAEFMEGLQIGDANTGLLQDNMYSLSDNSILFAADTALSNLLDPGASSASYTDWQALQINTSSFMSSLLTDTNVNIVENFYSYAGNVGQCIVDLRTIASKAYIVYAFALQLNAYRYVQGGDNFDWKNDVSGNNNVPADVFKDIQFPLAVFNPDGTRNIAQSEANLANAVNILNKNFMETYYESGNNAFKNFASLSNGNLNEVIFSNIPTSGSNTFLSGPDSVNQFSGGTCMPLSYINELKGSSNMNYFAAECTVNDQTEVYQLYIPVVNSADTWQPALNNIKFLPGFGLTGDLQGGVIDQLAPDYKELSSINTMNIGDWLGSLSAYLNVSGLYGFNHYTTGHNDYGGLQGFVAKNSEPALNQYWSFGQNFTEIGATGTCQQYAYALTPNGHLVGLSLNFTVTEASYNPDAGDYSYAATLQFAWATPGFAGNIGPNRELVCNVGAVSDWTRIGYGGGLGGYTAGNLVFMVSAPKPDTSSYPVVKALVGSECCGWQWVMTQVEGNNWKGEWFGGGTPFALDALTLSEDNNVVTITRQGGYGNGGCTYTGTVTGTEASGTYQCDWSDVNDWRGNFMSIPEPNS